MRGGVERRYFEAVLAAQNHLDILKAAYREIEAHTTYAKLSSTAGFSAPAHSRDVLTGRRPVTRKSAEGMCKALGVTGPVRSLFYCLLERDRPSLFSTPTPDWKRREREITLRDTLRVRLERADGGLQELYRYWEWPFIYAALGDETGAELSEILSRTGLGKTVVRRILETLVDKGLVTKSGARYIANESFVSSSALGKSEDFRLFYLSLLDKSRKLAKSGFDEPEHGFNFNGFSIKSSQMPEMKKELYQVMNDFAMKFHSAVGDQVVSLVSAMFPVKHSNQKKTDDEAD